MVKAFFNLFGNKKPKPVQRISFEKSVEYRGYEIILWGNQILDDRSFIDVAIRFDIGWRVNGKGTYTTTNSSTLKYEAAVQLEKAKGHVDKLILMPEKIKSIEEQIQNIL